MWPEYCGGLLRELAANGIHTALQTCGYFEYDAFEREMLPWLDLVMFDLKILDPSGHIEHTGRDNRTILTNFSRLSKVGIAMVPRVPLVPGLTASDENLDGIRRFLERNGFGTCSYLPYNPMGLSKWERIGKPRPILLE